MEHYGGHRLGRSETLGMLGNFSETPLFFLLMMVINGGKKELHRISIPHPTVYHLQQQSTPHWEEVGKSKGDGSLLTPHFVAHILGPECSASPPNNAHACLPHPLPAHHRQCVHDLTTPTCFGQIVYPFPSSNATALTLDSDGVSRAQEFCPSLPSDFSPSQVLFS